MSDWQRTVTFVAGLCLVLTLVFPWVLAPAGLPVESLGRTHWLLGDYAYDTQPTVTELSPLWEIDSDDRVRWDLVALQVLAIAGLGTVLCLVGIPPYVKPDSNWKSKPHGK